MLPWLITTTAWPGFATHVAEVTVRVAAEPVTAGSAAAALALACAAVLGRRGRAGEHPGRRPT